MKVKQLIEKLQEMDEELNVYLEDIEEGETLVYEVAITENVYGEKVVKIL